MANTAAATTDEKPPMQQSEENPPPPHSAENPHVSQSSETLTLNVVPDSQDSDSNQEDLTSSAPMISFSPTSASSARRIVGGGGGLKGKKSKRLIASRLKKIQKKLEALNENLKPIPFKPAKDLDFDSHEELLKRLGLWDFVKLRFDANIRFDLVAQLIASYDPQQRGSYVNEARVKVSRPDLARALKLPIKKDKVSSSETSAGEAKESEEAIAFVDELVSTWMLLHDDDTWLMPLEIHNMTRMIKDGNFERLDWAGLIWYMVEKELSAAPNLGNCYYASHLQCLIKSQKENMLREEKEIDFKEELIQEEEEDEDEEVVVKTSEEVDRVAVVAKAEEGSIELSLGGMDNATAGEDGGAKDKYGGKDDVVPQQEQVAMVFEESKVVVEEEHGQWLNGSVNENFLQHYSLVKAEDGMECEVEGDDDAMEEPEQGEEADDEESVEEMDFYRAPQEHDALGSLASKNLLGSMELAQAPLISDMQQLHADLSSGEFLAASRIDIEANPGNSSHYGAGNDLKRDIRHLDDGNNDDDIPHHAFDKRMRTDDAPWEGKNSSETGMCIGQIQHWLEKLRVAQKQKDQLYQEQSLNQQVLINELERRDDTIQLLHKMRYEEQQKSQAEVYKLERELCMMGDLLEGYRRALKESHRAFSEYRAKFPSHEEPLYKDAGPGGLVLTAAELEKQRMMEEEEERLARLLIEKKLKEFEEEWVDKFEGYRVGIELLGDRLLGGEKNVKLLMEMHLKEQKAPQISESTPTE
ncbi:unnamed protein product [Linum tenue]|uniref:Uncharacterized protein n=1 Tax=Linum tenue TaxID=586396 RepID=A0AAV0RBW9_9ROSI|nr:unnamed protein product [Linum tenue]